jgi:F0F1-type ATP synthase membrane subunit c/vacuolar-type H+-ATPase subunit K
VICTFGIVRRVINRAVPVIGAGLMVALVATGCSSFGDDSAIYSAASSLAVQPYPANYRADLLAFMRTYLNDPRSVRDAVIAEPVERSVGGKQRFIVCLRYTATGQGDAYNGGGDRAAIFLDGRMERLVEKARELCVGATYAAFPEMEKLTR